LLLLLQCPKTWVNSLFSGILQSQVRHHWGPIVLLSACILFLVLRPAWCLWLLCQPEHNVYDTKQQQQHTLIAASTLSMCATRAPLCHLTLACLCETLFFLLCLHNTAQVRCLRCGYVSNSYDPFMDLSLELQPGCGDLRQCMRHFTAAEMLDGKNCYRWAGPQFVCLRVPVWAGFGWL
jgi:hypothetical protein